MLLLSFNLNRLNFYRKPLTFLLSQAPVNVFPRVSPLLGIGFAASDGVETANKDTTNVALSAFSNFSHIPT